MERIKQHDYKELEWKRARNATDKQGEERRYEENGQRERLRREKSLLSASRRALCSIVDPGSFSTAMSSTRQDPRAARLTADASRRKRETEALQLRARNREEMMAKRRMTDATIAATPIADVDAAVCIHSLFKL